MKIIALSDLHGDLPFIDPVEAASADLLVIAGDICPDYAGNRNHKAAQQLDWMQTVFAKWFHAIPCEHKYVTWGNHDWLNGKPWAWVKHNEQVTVGDKKIWFSPWVPRLKDWNWGAEEDELRNHYDRIPKDTDIIVSHCPPFGSCDQISKNPPLDDALGSYALLEAIRRVKPRVVFCGHIHGGYGTDVIRQETGPDTLVLNVAVKDESYRMVNAVTVLTLDEEDDLLR